MKNIHLLPTQSKTRLFLSNYGKILNLASYPETFYTTGQNIYITSDEEIKEGDWFYLDDAKIIAKYINVKPVKEAKKIILTTDQDLIKDCVQAIDDEFLEWFVKNPSCEEVEVEVIDDNIQWYKIIIPKEEHKGKALSEQEVMDNRSSAYDFIDVDKQETTLEEAAERYWAKQPYNEDAFIAGAKWQQERSYSEEDMLQAFEFYAERAICDIKYLDDDFTEFIKQFKKK